MKFAENDRGIARETDRGRSSDLRWSEPFGSSMAGRASDTSRICGGNEKLGRLRSLSGRPPPSDVRTAIPGVLIRIMQVQGRCPLARIGRVMASLDQPQQMRHQENDQHGPEPDTSAATVTPAAVAVVSASAAQEQYQENNEYQHFISRRPS